MTTPKERAWDLIASNFPIVYDDGDVYCGDLAEAIEKLYTVLDNFKEDVARLDAIEAKMNNLIADLTRLETVTSDELLPIMECYNASSKS